MHPGHFFTRTLQYMTPGGQEFPFLIYPLISIIFLIFPQTILIFVLILALLEGDLPTGKALAIPLPSTIGIDGGNISPPIFDKGDGLCNHPPIL